MVRKQKAVSRGLRYDAELDKRIEAATKKGGFSSPSAFMREAIERELAGRESGVDAAEQRIAASLDRMARGIRNLRIGQQAESPCSSRPCSLWLREWMRMRRRVAQSRAGATALPREGRKRRLQASIVS